jgi:hypothetical protein
MARPPGLGELCAGIGKALLPKPERSKRLTAFAGESGDPLDHTGIADRRQRRVHIVEDERRPGLGGDIARGITLTGTPDPEVTEETVAFEWHHEAGLAMIARKGQGRAPPVDEHPPL